SSKILIPRKEKVIFWISKFLHIVVFIIVPIIFVGFIPTLIGILVASMVCGICLATVFQLAHVVSITDFKTIENHRVEDEWMVHLLHYTSNIATDSTFLTWLLDEFNFQVEHHIFPKISYIHYPELNRIVKATFKEYGIIYNESPTFWAAFNSHFKVIRSM